MNLFKSQKNVTNSISHVLINKKKRKHPEPIITIRQIEEKDIDEVRQLLHDHFNSLTIPAVIYWSIQHIYDLLVIIVINYIFFLDIKKIFYFLVIFIIYLYIRAKLEFLRHIRKDCPDLENLYKSYINVEGCNFWVAEVFDNNSDSVSRTTCSDIYEREKVICEQEKEEQLKILNGEKCNSSVHDINSGDEERVKNEKENVMENEKENIGHTDAFEKLGPEDECKVKNTDNVVTQHHCEMEINEMNGNGEKTNKEEENEEKKKENENENEEKTNKEVENEEEKKKKETENKEEKKNANAIINNDTENFAQDKEILKQDGITKKDENDKNDKIHNSYKNHENANVENKEIEEKKEVNETEHKQEEGQNICGHPEETESIDCGKVVFSNSKNKSTNELIEEMKSNKTKNKDTYLCIYYENHKKGVEDKGSKNEDNFCSLTQYKEEELKPQNKNAPLELNNRKFNLNINNSVNNNNMKIKDEEEYSIKYMNRKIVGCVGIVPYKGDSSIAQLVRMVVKKDNRRMRIGSRLLTQLENFAHEQNYKELKVFTNNLNTDSLYFVKQHGFNLSQIVRRGLMRGDLLIWSKILNKDDFYKYNSTDLQSYTTNILD